MSTSPPWTDARSGQPLDAELMSKGPQRHRTLTRRARPTTGADQVQTAALQFRRLSNGDATARPHRSPSLPRNASTRWYSPAQLCWQPRPMSQRLPCPRTNPPWAVPVKPTSAGPGPTEREPRSHCFDVTHQVRGALGARRPTSERAAKGTRHRRGHIISPRRMEASSEVASSSRRSRRSARPSAASTRAMIAAARGLVATPPGKPIEMRLVRVLPVHPVGAVAAGALRWRPARDARAPHRAARSDGLCSSALPPLSRARPAP